MLKRIVKEVEATSPAIVIVDSFRSVMQAAKRRTEGLDVQHFVRYERQCRKWSIW